MRDEMRRREIEEAAAAGEKALYSLENAREKLQGAKNWGIFDMLGGGFYRLGKAFKNVRRHRLYGRGKETIACIPEGA